MVLKKFMNAIELYITMIGNSIYAVSNSGQRNFSRAIQLTTKKKKEIVYNKNTPISA